MPGTGRGGKKHKAPQSPLDGLLDVPAVTPGHRSNSGGREDADIQKADCWGEQSTAGRAERRAVPAAEHAPATAPRPAGTAGLSPREEGAAAAVLRSSASTRLALGLIEYSFFLFLHGLQFSKAFEMSV